MKASHAVVGLTVIACLAFSAKSLAQQCCPVHRPDRPDLVDPAAWARSEQRITTEAWIVSTDDGILTIDVAGHRFTSKPDKGTRFSAEKATDLSGRKHLTLADFAVGSPIKVTFLADSGNLVEVRLIREKVVETSSRSAANTAPAH
jgi:hypothetical protein